MKRLAIMLICIGAITLGAKLAYSNALMESDKFAYSGTFFENAGCKEVSIYTKVPGNGTIPEDSSNYYYLQADGYNGGDVLVGWKQHRNPWWQGSGQWVEQFVAYKHKNMYLNNNYYASLGGSPWPAGTIVNLSIYPGGSQGKWVGLIRQGLNSYAGAEVDAGISDFYRSGPYIWSDNGASSETEDGTYKYFWGYRYLGYDATRWWGYNFAFTTQPDFLHNPVAGNTNYGRRVVGRLDYDPAIGMGGQVGLGTYRQ